MKSIIDFIAIIIIITDISYKKSLSISPSLIKCYIIYILNSFLHWNCISRMLLWSCFIGFQVCRFHCWFWWNCFVICYLYYLYLWLCFFFLFWDHRSEFCFIYLLKIFSCCEFSISVSRNILTVTSLFYSWISCLQIWIRNYFVISPNICTCSWLIALFRIN